MAMRACKACGAEISDRAATCPHCGEPQLGALRRNRGCGTLIVLGVVLLAIAVVFPTQHAPSVPQAFAMDDALHLCQQAIEQASVNPATARVPYVEGVQRADGWVFVWPRDGRLQLQNGFGAMLAAQASCKVDALTHAVSALTIDGTALR